MKSTFSIHTTATFPAEAKAGSKQENQPRASDTFLAEGSHDSTKYMPGSSGFQDSIRKSLKRSASGDSGSIEGPEKKKNRLNTAPDFSLGAFKALPEELRLEIFRHVLEKRPNASAKSIAKLAPVSKGFSNLAQITLNDHQDVGMAATRRSISSLAVMHKKNHVAFRESIARFFEKNSHIAIDFSRLTGRQARIVLNELSQERHSHLVNLDLNFAGKNVPIDDLRKALSLIGVNNPHLQTFKLGLQQTMIDDDGVMEIAGALRHSGVTHLDLSDNHEITSDGATAIAEGLADSKLKHLDLRGNSIDDDGVIALTEALPLSRLTYLDLSANEFDDDTHEALLKLVRTLPDSGLTYLGLRSNELHDTILNAIDGELADSQLEHFDLGSNDELGEHAIAALRERNPGVEITV